MIRSTRHHIKDLNDGKQSLYQEFLIDYTAYVNDVITDIWNNGYDEFDVSKNQLILPKYIDYNRFDINTPLSARAKSSAVTQVSGIIRSAVEKQKRINYVNQKHDKSLKNKTFSKPHVKNIRPMLSSKCMDWIDSSGKFMAFVRIKSIGKKYGHIRIPIIRHPRTTEKRLNGISFGKSNIQITWEYPTTPNNGSTVVGADQGYKTVLTLSDGQITPNRCPHGHSLESIIKSMSRKRQGSKGFKKAQAHRKNHINWSINQLNMNEIKEIRLEKITNMGYKSVTSRNMKHWCNPEIRDKLILRCEQLEVPIIHQSSVYRSQRCSSCGLTRKSNRQGKTYSCDCGNTMDADLNASKNHEIDLPNVDGLRNLGYNIEGFYWNPVGVYDLEGSEIRVPSSRIEA